MSKKSAYRRRKPLPTAYVFNANTWNRIRAHLGWPETGEPVPYATCLQLQDGLEGGGSEEAEIFAVLLVMVTEGWRQSYPAPPQQVLMGH